MSCSIVTTERQLTAVVRAKVPFAEIPTAQRSGREKLAAALPSLGAGAAGAAITRFRTPPTDGLDMEIGCIVARSFEDRGDVVLSELPAGRAAHVSMKGSFEGLPAAWQTLFDWGVQQGLTFAGANWEIYGAEQDAELYALLTG
jgi:effector-binding domain-containing protein